MLEVKEVVLTKKQQEELKACLEALSECDYTWYFKRGDYFALERCFIAFAFGYLSRSDIPFTPACKAISVFAREFWNNWQENN